jgi:hypothetical protein
VLLSLVIADTMGEPSFADSGAGVLEQSVRGPGTWGFPLEPISGFRIFFGTTCGSFRSRLRGGGPRKGAIRTFSPEAAVVGLTEASASGEGRR